MITLHNNNATWTEIFSGTALHIYTIISIIACDQVDTAGTISIRINNGTDNITILEGQNVASKSTFIWSDKFVLEEDDDLDVYNSNSNTDWYITYIDQDWT